MAFVHFEQWVIKPRAPSKHAASFLHPSKRPPKVQKWRALCPKLQGELGGRSHEALIGSDYPYLAFVMQPRCWARHCKVAKVDLNSMQAISAALWLESSARATTGRDTRVYIHTYTHTYKCAYIYICVYVYIHMHVYAPTTSKHQSTRRHNVLASTHISLKNCEATSSAVPTRKNNFPPNGNTTNSPQGPASLRRPGSIQSPETLRALLKITQERFGRNLRGSDLSGLRDPLATNPLPAPLSELRKSSASMNSSSWVVSHRMARWSDWWTGFNESSTQKSQTAHPVVH